MNLLKLINRNSNLFQEDVSKFNSEMQNIISDSKFLIIGGAGSIGQSVSKEIFKRNPLALHIVDISENNLVELVRDIRSTFGYIKGDFKTFAIDVGKPEYMALMNSVKSYDYVLNLSALKHVRSERDPFTLMRLIEVNILNTIETIRIAKEHDVKKYFCVSTDKAANPINMMGASKKIMEMFLMKESDEINVSTARYANVAFSDGSLLHGINQRLLKLQPISAPVDIQRYFVTPQESGELCLMSCLLGKNRDIFFPKLNENLDLISFTDIIERYLKSRGYKPHYCSSENEARSLIHELVPLKKWPCYFFESDTTGEKNSEEFYTEKEDLDLVSYKNIGIIKNRLNIDDHLLSCFLDSIHRIRAKKIWNKEEILDAFQKTLSEFNHYETNKNLDERM